MSINFPNADFTPQLAGYTGQGAFRFWCQKVLPIVYDDSLSYYELLNKVVNYLNNVIADVASVENNIGQLNTSYINLQNFVNETNDNIETEINEFETFVTTTVRELQTFVNNYFDNLDVQQEINHKLDVMASDGSLTALLRPLMASEAPGVIEQWMNEHITPTTPVVDSSLSIAGAAADARIVGNRLIPLETKTETTLPFTIAQANRQISYDDGSVSNNNFSSITNYVLVTGFDYIRYSRCVSTSETPRVGIAFYSYENGVFTFISGKAAVGGGSSLAYTDDIVEIPSTATHARFTLWTDNTIGFYVHTFVLGDNGRISDYGYTQLSQCIKDGVYREGRNYTATLTDLPADYDENNGACTLYVTRPAYADTSWVIQRLVNLIGVTWWRTMNYGSGRSWSAGEWHKLPHVETISNVTALDESLRTAISWDVGTAGSAINADTGRIYVNELCSATRYIDISEFSSLQYAQCWSTVNASSHGIAFYTDKNQNSFISGVVSASKSLTTKYKQNFVDVPDNAVYARFTMWSDSVDKFYLFGYPKNPLLKGKKLSILGDSISTFPGWIPEGNQTYYTGSNAGVSGVDQLWWYILCKQTGMDPLVIDAWSGSSIAYNYSTRPDHSDTVKIPMCSNLRTGRLSTDTDKPDVIIIAGGLNDWTYSQETTTPIGDWDGHTSINVTAVLNGTATFTESYAHMINRLQTLYPYAIIVCMSLFFTNRGTSLGAINVNDIGNTENDYNKAIEKVCKIMGVPFIDIYNIGFTRQNIYPTFAQDDETEATHPNSIGHGVIAKKIINNISNAILQFFGPYVPKE